MFNKHPIIICGSGSSINDGRDMGLFNILKNNITIGLNFWYKYVFEPSFVVFCDHQFYRNNIDDLEKQALIIGKHDPLIRACRINRNKPIDLLKPNTLLLPKHSTYFGENSWKIWERKCLNCQHQYEDDFRLNRPDKCPKCDGKQIQKNAFYSGHLSGLFSLTLAVALGFKDIYLLGFDCTEYKGKTHFYQDKIDLEKKDVDGNKIFHGIGTLNHKNGTVAYKTSTYNSVSNLNDLWFAPYKKELKNINIINVSPISKINIFPKMEYKEFFEVIDKVNINQDEVRKEIREYIEEKTKHENYKI